MDDPRPLRLRPQTEEPARAHVSPPTLNSRLVPLAASEEVFAEARAVLVREGVRRRNAMRRKRAIHIGTLCGLAAFFFSHYIWHRPYWMLQAAMVVLPLVNLFQHLGPSYWMASRRQKAALANLVPGAEKSDLSWLIEGTEYADTPELRLALLEKIRGFLADLTPEDAVLLPEGARKILRGWPNGLLRQEPERIRETLRALAVIEDPKLPQVLKGIARWRPRHFGDEETIRLATDALGLPPREFPAPPATRGEAEKAVVREIALRKTWNAWSWPLALLAFLLLLAGFAAGFLESSVLFFMLGWIAIVGMISLAIAKYVVDGESAYREAVAKSVLTGNPDG